MSQAAALAKPRATYQDVLDAPEHMVAEIINGELHLHPRPASRHAAAYSVLGGRLVTSFGEGGGGPGGWWIIDEPELHLGEDVLVPDIAGWKKERMPQYPDVAYFTLAPDWVCEILSPSTRKTDLTEKRDIYAREDVAHLWFVDPIVRTLEAFALEKGRWVLLRALRDEADISITPFDAITFPLGALWPD